MRSLFKATLIVTIFSVLTRALGFVLRIVLSRSLGAQMLGSYQVSMSILGVLMTIIASGLPLVVSRSVAYNKSIKENNKAYASVSAGLIVCVSLSIFITIFLYLFPNILSIFNPENLTINIVLFALPSLVFSAVYAILRSALWGNKHFFAISFTEFFEQVVRIILCIILFTSPIFPSVSMGEKAALSLSTACLLSMILVIIVYFSLKHKLVSPKGAIKPLIKGSSSVTALRTVSSVVSSLITIIIPIRLVKYGYTQPEAMAQFGMIMGMAFPLIMIPGTLIGSVAVTLVPEISSKTDNIDNKEGIKDINGLKNNIFTGIIVSILISMLLMPAYIVLGKPICQILFGSSEAGKYVSAGAFLMLPLGINQISSSILNSIGLELKSLLNYAISAIFLIISLLFLPKYIGTYSLIVGFGLLSIISASLNILMLKKRNLIKKGFLGFISSSIAFAIFSAILTKLIFNLLKRILGLVFSTIICGTLATCFLITLYFCFNISNVRGFFFKRFKTKHKLQ